MPRSKDFDPLAYIEDAFLDAPKRRRKTKDGESDNGVKFRKTAMSAPRPRMKQGSDDSQVLDDDLRDAIEALPRSIEFLGKFYADDVTANYYQGEFKESRTELIRRLIDPVLTLAEVSRLLGVCPATVRRYTNRGWLEHHRTPGGQRRFRLSGLVRFVDEHGRTPEDE